MTNDMPAFRVLLDDIKAISDRFYERSDLDGLGLVSRVHCSLRAYIAAESAAHLDRMFPSRGYHPGNVTPNSPPAVGAAPTAPTASPSTDATTTGQNPVFPVEAPCVLSGGNFWENPYRFNFTTDGQWCGGNVRLLPTPLPREEVSP